MYPCLSTYPLQKFKKKTNNLRFRRDVFQKGQEINRIAKDQILGGVAANVADQSTLKEN